MDMPLEPPNSMLSPSLIAALNFEEAEQAGAVDDEVQYLGTKQSFSQVGFQSPPSALPQMSSGRVNGRRS